MTSESEIDVEDVSEGDVVQYENKYHAAAVAEVVDVQLEEDYQSVEIKVLEPIFGPYVEGETVELGKTTDENLQHYVNWKLKTPGSMTDYVNVETLEDHRERMLEIAEEYGGSDS